MFRSPRVISFSLVLLGVAIGFLLGNTHEIRVLYARHRLKSAIENHPLRPDGRWDMSLEEPLEAIEWLRKLGAEREACQVLIGFLHHPSDRHRMAAYLLFMDLDEFAIPAIPELARIVADSSQQESDRQNAQESIELIRSQVLERLGVPEQ